MYVATPCEAARCQDIHPSSPWHFHLLCDLCAASLEGDDASLLVRLLPAVEAINAREMRSALVLPDGRALYGATFALYSRCAACVHGETSCICCQPCSSWAYLPLGEAMTAIALRLAGAGLSPSSGAAR
jgi:hypothetical protein